MKNKKILIICNHFAPDNTIAAVRITKIAKYLKKSGYSVTVIAEKKNDTLKDEILEKDAFGIRTIRIDNSVIQKNKIKLYKKIIKPFKDSRFDNLDNRIKINPKTGNEEFYPFETAYPVIGSMDYISELLRQYDLFQNAKKILDRCGDFDYIFTSYGDYFGYFCGHYFHKRFENVPWVFDIRDSIYRYKFTPDYVSFIAKNIEKNIWKNADAIIGVSKGICMRVPKEFRKKVMLISNGYDLTDRIGCFRREKSSDKLVFSYTGSMYGGLQNLSVFFKSISELIKINKLKSSDIEIRYAGNEPAFNIFKSQANKYNVEHLCRYMGKLERKDALKLQCDSDILLVAAYDYNEGNGGVITGKALEYMSAGKPIISIVTGDLKNNELTEIIRKGKLGFAYEESNDKEDYLLLKKYICKIYKEFKENSKIEFNPDKNLLKKFDYRYITRRIEKLLEKLELNGRL